MKKILAALATVVLVAMPSHGEIDTLSVPELGVSVFSRHAWRGQSGPDAMSIQPEAIVPLGTAGTALSLWGQIPTEGSDTEIDFTVTQDVKGVGKLFATSYYYDGSVLDAENHDLEIGVSTAYNDISLLVGRFIYGEAVKGDTWVQLGYELGGISLFAGVGDGSYISDGDGFGLAQLGASIYTENGYGATFLVNPDTERPMFIVGKSW